MVRLLEATARRVRIFYHRMAGRLSFRFGRAERARRHFEQVLADGDDFVAYFYLARLAYSAGDAAGYRREMEHARRTSPERMAKMNNVFDYLEPMHGAVFERTGDRTSWQALRVSSVGGEPTRAGERGLSSCPGGELRRYGDDFSSTEERERFADLPPISRSEIASVDLDHLTGEF